MLWPKYRQFTWINFCYLVAPIFWGEFLLFFTNKGGLKKILRTANCPKNLHVKNEVILWPLTSSKIIVLVAQPISTDGGPPAWAVDKRAELGWPSSRGKGWPTVCKSGLRLGSFTVTCWIGHKSIWCIDALSSYLNCQSKSSDKLTYIGNYPYALHLFATIYLTSNFYQI